MTDCFRVSNSLPGSCTNVHIYSGSDGAKWLRHVIRKLDRASQDERRALTARQIREIVKASVVADHPGIDFQSVEAMIDRRLDILMRPHRGRTLAQATTETAADRHRQARRATKQARRAARR